MKKRSPPGLNTEVTAATVCHCVPLKVCVSSYHRWTVRMAALSGSKQCRQLTAACCWTGVDQRTSAWEGLPVWRECEGRVWRWREMTGETNTRQNRMLMTEGLNWQCIHRRRYVEKESHSLWWVEGRGVLVGWTRAVPTAGDHWKKKKQHSNQSKTTLSYVWCQPKSSVFFNIYQNHTWKAQFKASGLFE